MTRHKKAKGKKHHINNINNGEVIPNQKIEDSEYKLEILNTKMGDLRDPKFDYYINPDTGDRVYLDPNVQTAYVNLGRIGDFITACQYNSELEYTNVCQNVSVDGKANTELSFLVNLLCKGFDFMGDIEFPWIGKEGGKVVGMLLSGLVEDFTVDTPKDLQNDFNNVWDGLKAAFNCTKLQCDAWREDIEKYWSIGYKDNNGDITTISQLGEHGYIPEKNTTEFDHGAIAIAGKSVYWMCMKLVPTKWHFRFEEDNNWWDCYYTRWNSNYPYEGPYYDGLTVQTLFGHTTSFPDQVLDEIVTPNPYNYIWTEHAEQYEHHLLSNDRNYVGNVYHRYYFVDNNGNTAPDSLTKYLFSDNPGGTSGAVTTRSVVFNNWGCK